MDGNCFKLGNGRYSLAVGRPNPNGPPVYKSNIVDYWSEELFLSASQLCDCMKVTQKPRSPRAGRDKV